MMKQRLVAFALLITMASSASAATIVATPAQPIVPGFTIEFTDANNDNLFELTELDSFSGAFLFVPLESILAVPAIAGISLAGSVPGATLGPLGNAWYFDAAGSLDNVFDVGAAPDFWTYEIRVAPVPAPGTLPLLLAAIGGLALARRRRRTRSR